MPAIPAVATVSNFKKIETRVTTARNRAAANVSL
jgi:hypothetical protein